MSEFIESNHLLSSKQYGFRKGLFTTEAVLSLVETMGLCLEKRIPGIAPLLDLSKAFDCGPHERLLQKLCMYNLAPPSCKLISSFLRNRYQVIKTNSQSPQGSVLGPLPF